MTPELDVADGPNRDAYLEVMARVARWSYNTGLGEELAPAFLAMHEAQLDLHDKALVALSAVEQRLTLPDGATVMEVVRTGPDSAKVTDRSDHRWSERVGFSVAGPSSAIIAPPGSTVELGTLGETDAWGRHAITLTKFNAEGVPIGATTVYLPAQGANG